MSTIDYYHRILERLKEKKQDEEFKRIDYWKARVKAVKEAFPSEPKIQTIAYICEAIIGETESRMNEDLAIMELVLGLLSDHVREVDILKSVITPLISERKELMDKIKKMEESLSQREKILDELERAVEERRKFYEEHR